MEVVVVAATRATTPTPRDAVEFKARGGWKIPITKKEGIFKRLRDIPVTCSVIKMRIFRGKIPPLPKSKAHGNQSNPMCLPWHTRGECNEGCNCYTDHNKYPDEDLRSLDSWCDKYFQTDDPTKSEV